ncbi:MAG: lytic transglycosylase domain-containing protein [Anaerolineae bacterium]
MKRLAFLAFVVVLVGSVWSWRGGPYGDAPIAVGGGRKALAAAAAPAEPDISPYWHAKVQRWDTLIAREAERRNLDPDFLAALVWMESRGDARAVGPVGAVGLMQVMSKEAGFSWRPSQEALMDPGTNLFWGTRTLATVIRQGNGDIFNALAAYNGGWEQTMYRGPKRLATTVLRDYAKAVAVREGVEGEWTAFFAVQEQGIRGPIWVVETDRSDVYFYGDANVTPEGGPLILDVPPTAVVARSEDPESGAQFAVGVWICRDEGGAWVTPAQEAASSVAASAVDVAGASGQPQVASPAMMAGSKCPTTPPAPVTVSELASLDSPPATTEPSPASRTAVPQQPAATPAPAVAACSGGALTVDAWPLERVNTPEGWKVRIFAEARGGNCVYTYAWNDESDVRGAGMNGPIVFEVTSSRRGAAIVGTVVVISGDVTQRVALYIPSPEP